MRNDTKNPKIKNSYLLFLMFQVRTRYKSLIRKLIRKWEESEIHVDDEFLKRVSRFSFRVVSIQLRYLMSWLRDYFSM